MGENLSGYDAVMRLSKNRFYYVGGGDITSDWLDVVNACYQVQLRVGEEYWDANTVTLDLKAKIKPGHKYFPGLTTLVEHGILEVRRIPVGVRGKSEPWYRLIDLNGVALALGELGYLRG